MADSVGGQVSVIIPARNEAASIALCVRSVAAQAGIREIIVVDDQSEDGTPEILEGLKAEIPVLQTQRIESLPSGWVGKNYALAMGTRLARGDWLLFTDADTEHLPGSLGTLLERAESQGVDLLSVSPGQLTPTWWGKAVIPRVYVELARLFPFDEVSDPDSAVAAANGQYILIRRDVYERAGGHEAVREEILEDVALARRVKLGGARLLFLPGAAWVRTRTYRTYSDLWAGWSKNLYPLYDRNLVKVLQAFTDVWFVGLAAPLAFLALSLLAARGLATATTPVAAAGCLAATVWSHWNYGRSLKVLGFDSGLAKYQIPGAALFGLLLLYSVSVHRWGRGIEWKGRRYSARGSTGGPSWSS